MKYIYLFLTLIFGVSYSVKVQGKSLLTNSSITDTAKYFTFGGTYTEEFRDVALTNDSGFILVGTSNGYGPGNSSIYAVRTNKKGSHLWSAVLGGSNVDKGSAVLSLSDGGFLVSGSSNSFGTGDYDGYIGKLDANGSKVWEKHFGGSDWDFVHDMIFLPDSSVILCGETYSNSNGGADAWVIKTDIDGNILWQNHFGSGGDDSFNGIAVSGDRIYLCGKYKGSDADGYLVKLDFSGHVIFEVQINYYGQDQFNAVAIANANSLILAGGSIWTGSTASEFWLQQVDSNGVSGWSIPGVGSEDDYLNSVMVKSNGDIVATGMKNPAGFGKKSMLTIQCDSGGTLSSFRPHTFGGAEDDEAFKCILRPEGGIALAGYTDSYGNGGLDACLVLLDTNEILPDYIYTPINFTETLSPIGLEEIESDGSDLSVFPNPFSEKIYFNFNKPFSKLSLKVYSMDGRLIQQTNFPSIFHSGINLSMLDPGCYLMEFSFDDRMISRLIVKSDFRK